MAEETRNNCCGESCDCGTFFLDFIGTLTPQQLHVQWSALKRQTNQEVENIIENTWAAEVDCARQNGRKLYDGHLCRLWECTHQGSSINLVLGEVSFKEFLGTNLTHAYLRYFHGPEILADALGVSAALRTSDGFLLLGRRSQRVLYHAGRIHPIGGVLERNGADTPQPFAAITEELAQETNLTGDHLGEIVCLGLVRDKHIVQPELIFDVVADADVAHARRLTSQAPDAEEHSELLAVRDHPAAVVTFIEQNYNELTPLALATLLLHGQRHWGSGWFAATRGYLRSVI